MKKTLLLFYASSYYSLKKINVVTLALIVLLSLPKIIFAEGSKDLYPVNNPSLPGYRSFLMARPFNANFGAFDPYKNPGIMRVYARAGETIYLGSSVLGKQVTTADPIGSIVLRNPSGTQVQLFYGTNTTTGINTLGSTNGLISNRTQELAGPNRPGVTTGYEALKYVVPAGGGGIYEVQFNSLGAGTNFAGTAGTPPVSPDWVPAGASTWIQPVATTSSALILAWDVSVGAAGNAGSLITGRLYSNVINLVGPNSIFNVPSFFGKFVVLTKSGYSYTVDANGINGAAFNFFSNTNGIRVPGTNNPAYTSLGYSDNTSFSNNIAPRIHDPRLPDNGDNITNKIFYNIPDASLPTDANVYYNGNETAGSNAATTTWLKRTVTEPLLSDVSVTCDGRIAFTSNIQGTYRIFIDVNPGTPPAAPANRYEETQDVYLTGDAKVGRNVIHWNQRNGNNVKVPVGNPVDIIIQLADDISEVHFPLADMESNKNGIKIYLNNAAGAPILTRDTVFWNDVDIIALTSQRASNPQSNRLLGRNSETNGHIWGTTLTTPTNTSTGGANAEGVNYGNNRMLDTWTFVKASASYNISAICVGICGNVYHDNDGNANVNPSGGTIPAGIYANLVDNAGNVVQSVPVDEDGGYSFLGLSNVNTTYTIRLTTGVTAIGSPLSATTLPAGWSNTGQVIGDETAGNDGNAADGALTVTIVMNGDPIVNANFGINAAPVTISGTVFNDNNADALIAGAGEVGTNGGDNNLTVYLVDASGNIVSSSVVNASTGAYSFNNAAMPATPYTVVLSTQAGLANGTAAPATASVPSGYVSTGESYGTGNNAGTGTQTGAGNTQPGIIAVTPSITGTTNVNFGINQPPAANDATEPNRSNPGGTNRVDITNQFVSSDANGGIVTSLTITSLPTNATSITVGTTTYYANNAAIPAQCPTATCLVFPATGGVTIATNNSGTPQSPISVDPIDGTTTVEVPYTVTDNAGLTSNPATITLPFIAPISFSGVVFNDVNENATQDNGEQVINGSIVPITVYLIDADGNVVSSAPLQADGSYTVYGLPNTPYTIQLNTTEKTNVPLAAPSMSIPAGYHNIGWEYGNNNTTGTGEIKSNTGIIILNASGTVTNANFALKFGSLLPVALVKFVATKQQGYTLLQWTTALEQNNKGFEILRSYNGNNWNPIGFVNSAGQNGNSTQKTEYNFKDLTSNNGNVYYRLNQVDFDGKATLSNIVVLSFDNAKTITAYPNPVTNQLNINGLSGNEIVKVINLTGKQVNTVHANGNQTLQVLFNKLPAGMYFVTIVKPNGNTTNVKVVKNN